MDEIKQTVFVNNDQLKKIISITNTCHQLLTVAIGIANAQLQARTIGFVEELSRNLPRNILNI